MNLPEPTHFSPTQAMRWRRAVRVLEACEGQDINKLDPASRTLTMDRLRRALAEALHLIAETAPGPDLSKPAQEPDEPFDVL